MKDIPNFFPEIVIKSFAHYRGGTLVFPFNRTAHKILTRSAPENDQEVDTVINIKNPMTAQIPSASGMPAYGHALGTTTFCTTGVDTSVVRDRQAVIGTDLCLAQGYFPGTPAWRPPNC